MASKKPSPPSNNLTGLEHVIGFAAYGNTKDGGWSGPGGPRVETSSTAPNPRKYGSELEYIDTVSNALVSLGVQPSNCSFNINTNVWSEDVSFRHFERALMTKYR
jgi:hypothetical protein